MRGRSSPPLSTMITTIAVTIVVGLSLGYAFVQIFHTDTTVTTVTTCSGSTTVFNFIYTSTTTTITGPCTTYTSTITTTVSTCSGTSTIYGAAPVVTKTTITGPCTTVTSDTTSGVGNCQTCLVAPAGFTNSLVRYFTNTYNSQVGMIAVANSGSGGVNFCYMDSTSDCTSYCGLVPFNQKFLPFESWKDAAGMDGLGVQPAIVQNIYSSITQLYSSVHYHAPWNLESTLGYIIPYKIQNTNICFTASYGPPQPSVNGFNYQVDQAAVWNYATQSFKQPDMTVSDGLGKATANINIIAQALNFYLRGDLIDAQNNLQYVANTCSLYTDGSARFDRPMTIGMFLEAYEVMSDHGWTPSLPNGCTIPIIENTLFALQNSDGGIASSYTCAFGSSCSQGGSTDENSNAALDAFAPNLILHVQAVAASHAYNLQSQPSPTPTIGI